MLEEGRTEREIEDRLKGEKCTILVPITGLRVENGVLYKELITPYGNTTKAVLLLSEYIPKALQLAHSSPTAGHGGTKVTLSRCRKFAFWPGMKKT